MGNNVFKLLVGSALSVVTACSLGALKLMWSTSTDVGLMLERETLVHQRNNEIHQQFYSFMNAGPRFTPDTFEQLNQPTRVALGSLSEANKTTMAIARDIVARTVELEKSVAVLEQRVNRID